MWSCDYLPFSGGWWGGFFPGGIWPLLVSGLAIVLLVFLAIKLFRSLSHNSSGSFRDRIDSQAILKARFARGEITQEEFVKMKRILGEP